MGLDANRGYVVGVLLEGILLVCHLRYMTSLLNHLRIEHFGADPGVWGSI